MNPVLHQLEEIRAEISGETVEEIEAVKHLDALAWWLSEFQRKYQCAE